MTDVKVEMGKFTSAVKAEEGKAASWIARHPGWTLSIGIVQFAVIAWLSLRHL